MRDFRYAEMMVHVPMCSSKEAKDILIISDDADILRDEVSKHAESNLVVLPCNLDKIEKLESNFFDVVISEMQTSETLFAQMDRVTKKDAQFVTLHPSLENRDENKKIMKQLAKYFKIIMPYNLGNTQTALFCSKEYHPTADINLQRADMLDGLNYYNSDIHPASFAMGNYIRREYLGIIKN